MPKRVLSGVVIRNSSDKTIVVRVDRRVQHPLYKKFMKRSKNYHAHDADNRHKVGDHVRIQECPPISKSKSWTVIEEAS